MSRTTLRDVAERACVSSATVSYVLNGKKKISDETKRRVHDAVRELDYVPDLNARGLSMRDSKLIGVVVPQTEPGDRLMFQNSFYSEILGSIEYHTREKGYHVIISATDANESYLTLAKKRNLDGIIVIGMYPSDFYVQMKASKIPIVLVDSYCNDNYFHNIRIDDEHGSYLETIYLLEKGHRDIAFFVGQIKESGVMKKRLSGYELALKEHNIPFKSDYIFEGQIDYENGVFLAQRLIDKGIPTTAVVCAADILAVGAMSCFYSNGIRVPEDISVIGFDDLEISRYLTPGLTTIKQHISLKGQRAVKLLLNVIENPDLPRKEEVLPLLLVERGSVMPRTGSGGQKRNGGES